MTLLCSFCLRIGPCFSISPTSVPPPPPPFSSSTCHPFPFDGLYASDGRLFGLVNTLLKHPMLLAYSIQRTSHTHPHQTFNVQVSTHRRKGRFTQTKRCLTGDARMRRHRRCGVSTHAVVVTHQAIDSTTQGEWQVHFGTSLFLIQ